MLASGGSLPEFRPYYAKVSRAGRALLKLLRVVAESVDRSISCYVSFTFTTSKHD
jgi:hypothetical protein